MTLEVVITLRAEQQLAAICRYIAERGAPQAAKRWAESILVAINSLGKQPQRFAIAQESANHAVEIREMLFGRHRSYRVLYSIQGEMVVILGIRHAAQDDFIATE